jgi:8-oxo-dGTP diphosphatase
MGAAEARETSAGVARELRVAAYAVCVREHRVLLTRLVGPDAGRWTLPGGGIDHGEDPYDAAIREVAEESGYVIEIDRLLGMDSFHTRYVRASGRESDFHGLRIIYSARVAGGELRPEADGSTDQAAWIDLDEVAKLERVSLVDIGLALDRDRPAHGRIDNQGTTW